MPSSHIFSTRLAKRSTRCERSEFRPISNTGKKDSHSSGNAAANGSPVIITISRALTIRLPFIGSIRLAAPSSSRASLACIASGPKLISSRSNLARSSSSLPGNSKVFTSAATYNIEPPTTIGSIPVSTSSEILALATS